MCHRTCNDRGDRRDGTANDYFTAVGSLHRSGRLRTPGLCRHRGLAALSPARIFVFAADTVERTERIENTKTKHHKRGGWSQAREHMPKEIADRVIETESFEIRTPPHEVLAATLATLRVTDAATDRERVDELIGAYRGGGLASVGVDAVKRAFELGQVDELVIAASPQSLANQPPGRRAQPRAGRRSNRAAAADTGRARRRRADSAGAQHVREDPLHRRCLAAGADRRRRRVSQVQTLESFEPVTTMTRER